MGVLASDTFTRADNTDLGTSWDVQSGGPARFGIVSNTATPSTTTTNDAGETYNGVTWPNDQYAQAAVTMAGTGGDTGPGVAVRCSTSAQTFYRAVVSKGATNNISISKFVAGTYTNLGFRTQAWTDGDILRLEVSGTTLKVFRNGVQLGANVTDASIASGRAGISSSSSYTSGSLDNWEGGDFTTAVTYQPWAHGGMDARMAPLLAQ